MDAPQRYADPPPALRAGAEFTADPRPTATMTDFGYAAVFFAIAFFGYTYVGYPLLLKLLALVRGPAPVPSEELEPWPPVSITVPMYNEEAQARGLVESLLALDYPPDKRQILIVSDGSTDRTNEIVGEYADRGVELIVQPTRSGKTACENAVAARLRSDIVVNTDASIRIRPEALKMLVAALADPKIGLSTGRDVSVAHAEEAANVGESGYVGYEMWVRDLETDVAGIVGASGSFYAIRSDLHRIEVPGSLSRDFSAALKCETYGYRAVSVPEAVCIVPRTTSISAEYSRKVRTITRGIETLVHWKGLLNPFRHGLFSWMLFSHKVCRWGLPWVAVLGGIGLVAIATTEAWARVVVTLGVLAVAVGLFGWRMGDSMSLPRPVRVAGFGVMGNVAAMHASLRALRGDRDPIWEPTRREGPATG